MVNRRTLFARLSAVALAPLAKFLPAAPVERGLTDAQLAAALQRAHRRLWDEMYVGLEQHAWPASPAIHTETLNLSIANLMRKVEIQAKPVPQEEA